MQKSGWIMCLDVTFSLHSFRLPFITLWSDHKHCQSRVCPHRAYCSFSAQGLSGSIHSNSWICLEGGIYGDILLDSRSQKWALPGLCWSMTRRKSKHRVVNKCADLKQTVLSNTSTDLCSPGNRCHVRFLCLLACFTLNYNTFELSASVKSSKCSCLPLESSSGSEQGLAMCVQDTRGWVHFCYWYWS